MTAPAEQITGGSHLGRIDISLGHHPATEEDGNLVGINSIVFRFAAMNGLHIESVPQDKDNPFLTTEVRYPIPGKPTFHPDHDILFIGSNHSQKRFGRGGQIFVHEFGAALIENADVPRFRVWVDATIMFMLSSIEIHPGLLVGVKFVYSHPTAATRSKGGLDEYQSVPPDRCPFAVLAEREESRLGSGR